MEKIREEPLPIPERDNMCPQIAAAVLNKKGYEIPITKPNCAYGSFIGFVESALTRRGLRLVAYEGPIRLAVGKLRLVNKRNDGVLLMRSRSNPRIFHFIAFIVVDGILLFYDADNGKMDVYRLKNNASATDFDEDFIELFPDYQVVQVALIESVIGGKRKRKTRRKTRKQRR